MDYLAANLAHSRVRRASLNGREHLVAPLTLIVPGVLSGSQGPLFYPPDEIGKNPSAWNHVPIVVYHPKSNDGSHVSARDPDVLDRQGIGVVLRARSNGKLIAEGWFDVEKTRKVDRRILQALEAGKQIELSTGLYTDNEPAPANSNHNGKPYSHIARNYRPDHLAILPDLTGACSIQDGCGVLVNKNAWWLSLPEGSLAENFWSQAAGYLKLLRKLGGPRQQKRVKPGMSKAPLRKGPVGKPKASSRYERRARSRRVRNMVVSNEGVRGRALQVWRELGQELGMNCAEAEAARKRRKRLKKQGITNTRKGEADMAKLTDVQRKTIIDVLIGNCDDCGWVEEDREALNAMSDKKLMTMDECRKAMETKNQKLQAAEAVANAARKGFLASQPGEYVYNEKAGKFEPKTPAKEETVTSDEKKPITNEKKPITNEELMAAMSPEMREDLAFARNEKAKQKQTLVTRLTANIEDAVVRQKQAERLSKRSLEELQADVSLLPAVKEDQPFPNYLGAAVPIGNVQAELREGDVLALPTTNWESQK